MAQRLILGSPAFAAGLLLIAPWPKGRERLLRRLAIPALLIRIATTGSSLVTPTAAQEAVVVEDGAVLRSADSFGAPAAVANPLPAGAELRMLETRGSWIRVSLADGTRGWLAAGTIERVEPM